MIPNLQVKPGQALSIKWRSATGVVKQNIQRLRLDPTVTAIGVEISCYVTYVDSRGVSVYIKRGTALGGDIQGFLPASEIMWQSYFEPLPTMVQGYIGKSHFLKIFPRQFL